MHPVRGQVDNGLKLNEEEVYTEGAIIIKMFFKSFKICMYDKAKQIRLIVFMNKVLYQYYYMFET